MKKVHFLLIAILFATCVFAENDNDFISNFVTTDGTRFVDNKGRTLILNGVNYVNKNGILSENDELVFKDFKKYGYNVIRFGIIWDRLEHEPGKMDKSYLEDIDKRVEWARENGIYLMFDFHQDLYGSKWGDGAPLWATLDDNLPHAVGEIWSDSYFLSPAINQAFDNFWNNRRAQDGIGIQDHYLNMLKVVARRYAKSPSVIGIDIFNEPYGGTLSREVPTLLLKSVMGFLPDSIKKDHFDFNSLREEKNMTIVLNLLENKDTYKTIISSCADVANNFERNQLSGFYQKARNVMRSAGFDKIIFLEHNYFGNLGMRSDFALPKDEKGQTDLRCVYSPHGYDIITDTPMAFDDNSARVDAIFEMIEQNGAHKHTPVMLGEWGAYYNSPAAYDAANHIARIIESKKLSQTYWSHDDNLYKLAYFHTAISRAFPRAVNGTLISYKNMPETKDFEMKWEECNHAKTIIYHPFVSNVNVSLFPKSHYKISCIPDSNAGYVIIDACKNKARRSIRIAQK